MGRRSVKSVFLVALLSFWQSFESYATLYYVNGESNRLVRTWGGEDGAFSDGPVQTGITGTSPTLTIDTDVKSEFRFSSFNISSGVTINVVGSNPLVIRVSDNATIAGTLSANGSDNLSVQVGSSGGPAGYSGGAGAITNPPGFVDPTDGLPSSGPSRGGLAGTNQGGAGVQRAGGGGCNGAGATDGTNNVGSAASCPLTQAQIADGFENIFVGGGGGAGGGIYTAVPPSANGNGGGGGGGAIQLAVDGNLVLTGTIEAKGGTGGDEDPPDGGDCLAAGGGGSGGSIWLQVGGEVTGSGTIDVNFGSGGATGGCGYLGGDGSPGVIRIDSTTNSFGGTYTPSGSVDLSYSLIVADFSSFLIGGRYWACSIIGYNEKIKDPVNSTGFHISNSLDMFVLFVFLFFLKYRNFFSNLLIFRFWDFRS